MVTAPTKALFLPNMQMVICTQENGKTVRPTEKGSSIGDLMVKDTLVNIFKAKYLEEESASIAMVRYMMDTGKTGTVMVMEYTKCRIKINISGSLGKGGIMDRGRTIIWMVRSILVCGRMGRNMDKE